MSSAWSLLWEIPADVGTAMWKNTIAGGKSPIDLIQEVYEYNTPSRWADDISSQWIKVAAPNRAPAPGSPMQKLPADPNQQAAWVRTWDPEKLQQQDRENWAAWAKDPFPDPTGPGVWVSNAADAVKGLLPDNTLLWLAAGAIGLSVLLFVAKR
jgi:hypothetical protein